MHPETIEAIDILRTPLLTSGTVELSCQFDVIWMLASPTAPSKTRLANHAG